MEFQEVYKIQSWGGRDGDKGVIVSAAVGRQCTDDENAMLYKFCNEFLSLVAKNNLLRDKAYMDNIAEDKKKLLACFDTVIYVKEIPNGYSSDMINPWFLITTNRGIIRMGWRKRVIHIDWDESDITYRSEDLFPEEDVTKFDRTIHAHGYEKAREYLTVLLNV